MSQLYEPTGIRPTPATIATEIEFVTLTVLCNALIRLLVDSSRVTEAFLLVLTVLEHDVHTLNDPKQIISVPKNIIALLEKLGFSVNIFLKQNWSPHRENHIHLIAGMNLDVLSSATSKLMLSSPKRRSP